MHKTIGKRAFLCIISFAVFLIVHIAFDWIVYQHNLFVADYYRRYLSGYFEIYLVVAIILAIGIMLKAKYFSIIFFICAVYGEVQMLFGYWKLGSHPTMGPAMLQFLIYISGFVIGGVVELWMRAVRSRNSSV